LHVAAIVVAVVMFVSGYVFLFLSINEQFQIQHEINRKLLPAEQFEPTIWWFGAWRRFSQLQKQLLPESPRPRKLRRFLRTSFVLFAAGMLLVAISLKV
jgi:hypothetical protein